MPFKLDPFLVSLLATLGVATVAPAQGAAVPFFKDLAIVLIALMFFLQGARLSRTAVLSGLTAWKLHLTILVCTFVLFPVLGLTLHALAPGLLHPDVWTGVLFLCCLPSTVVFDRLHLHRQRQCSRRSLFGNGFQYPGHLHNADAGRADPRQGRFKIRGALDIVFQLLLPFILGQLLQPWIGDWARRHKKLLSFSDRGSVLVVVYSAFSDAIVQGLWHSLPLSQLGIVALVDSALLAFVLVFTMLGSRLLGYSRADEVAIVFCGSKKTLASGVPMANVLFPASSVGLVVLPLMLC